MDFNTGPVDVFIMTKLVYVVTLSFTCVSLGFVATFLTLILLGLCREKVYE